VGLAGTVIQFVHFAASLFNGARKLYASSQDADCATGENLEEIYAKLEQFHSDLRTGNSRFSPATCGLRFPSQSDQIIQLRQIAHACQKDCSLLVTLLSNLRRKTNRRCKFWRCFQVALQQVMAGDEVKALQSRISQHQGSVTLILSSISWCVYQTGALV
jgi:hypothetical protein